MKYCVYCRNLLDDNMIYCPNCGNRQPEFKKNREKTEGGTGKKHSLVIPVVIISAVVSFLAIAAVIIFVIIRFGQDKEQTKDPNAATGIMLNWARKTIAPGERTPLLATALPLGSDLTEITWHSSDESVAEVLDGIVTGNSEGFADIYVTDAYGNSSKCRITVGTDPGEDSLAGFGDMDSNLVSVSGSVADDGTLVFSNGYIMENGYVLTTSNIADDKENLFVTMPDGSSEAARLISNDVENNVAVLEIVDHIDLTGVEDIGEISPEIGFTKALYMPKAGDTLYVLGFQDAYSSEPVIKEVTYREMIEEDGILIFCVYSSGQGLMGGIVTDAYGNVYGMNMIDDMNAEISLILPSVEVERAVRDQIQRVNQDQVAIETIAEEGRTNLYLDALVSHYGRDLADIAGQYDGILQEPIIKSEGTTMHEPETVTEETTEAPEEPVESERVRAARSLLEHVRANKLDYDEIGSITGERPVYVFYDINGDDIPEMVYSRVINVSGTASTMAVPSFDYSRAIQYQIAVFDQVDGEVRSYIPKVHIVINDSGDYLATFGGRTYFYVFDNDDHIYMTEYGNISGNARYMAEFSLDGHMGTTEIFTANLTDWGRTFISSTGTSSENMNRMIQDTSFTSFNTTLYDCWLLYDFSGESDLTTYSYEGAIDYLNSIINAG